MCQHCRSLLTTLVSCHSPMSLATTAECCPVGFERKFGFSNGHRPADVSFRFRMANLFFVALLAALLARCSSWDRGIIFAHTPEP